MAYLFPDLCTMCKAVNRDSDAVSFISHWNSWFDGLIFSNFPSSYPLASFLQTVVVQRDMTLLSLEDWQSMSMISDRDVRCAQIFVGIIPII